MKKQLAIQIIITALLFSACAIKQAAETEVAPRLGGWDLAWMTEVKDDLKKEGSEFMPAYNQLLLSADEALKAESIPLRLKR
jgi:hypothetical protein